MKASVAQCDSSQPPSSFMLQQEDTLLHYRERSKLLSALSFGQRPRSVSVHHLPETSLQTLFAEALPDKQQFHGEWLRALAEPSICIEAVEDVRRLDSEDIARLPVPPLVKALFRDVREEAARRTSQREDVVLRSAARQKEFFAQQRDKDGEPYHDESKALYFQDCADYRLILSREEIDTGVKIVASKIERLCKHERIILVGILTGACMFMTDLCRELKRPYSVQFIKASSYNNTKQQGDLTISMDISPRRYVAEDGSPIKIILVDELLDNGKTLEKLRLYFCDMLKDSHKDSDIMTCVLFTKARSRDWPLADICGIPELPDLWVNGYGLDDRETKRGWTELFATPKVRIVKTANRAETDLLIEAVDDSCKMVKTMTFGGEELTHFKPAFKVERVNGVQVTSKTHFASLLDEIGQPLKGKYENEVRLSFVAEDVPLVNEDEIFEGNEIVYAEMRLKLLDQLARDAAKAGVAH